MGQAVIGGKPQSPDNGVLTQPLPAKGPPMSSITIENATQGFWLVTYEQPDMAQGQSMRFTLLISRRQDMTVSELEKQALLAARKYLDDSLAGLA